MDAVVGIAQESGFAGLIADWRYLVMIVIACVLLYLAIVKQFEPLLLLPIAFGMLLANLPGSGIIHMEYFLTESGHPDFLNVLNNGGLADMLYLGVKLGIYPPLIFLGIGSMTDFGPLISNPQSLLLGAAAQLGIFMTYFGAKMLASPVLRPPQLASSAVRTARPPSMSPPSSPRICWARSRLPLTAIWRWSRSSSPPSCGR